MPGDDYVNLDAEETDQQHSSQGTPRFVGSPEDVRRYDAIKRSQRGFRGHFTRARTACGNLARRLTHEPLPGMEKAVEEKKEPLSRFFKKLEESYMQLQEIDTQQVEYYNHQLEKLQEDYENSIQQLEHAFYQYLQENPSTSSRLSRSASVAASEAPTQASGTGNQRPVDQLKPPVLTRQHAPDEFRSWIEKLRAFFSSSKIMNSPAWEQRAYLNCCLDITLEQVVRSAVPETALVFNECIDALKEEFSIRYPLFTRRLALFRLRQEPGELYSDFRSRSARKALEADLPSLTPDDILMLVQLAGCTDTALRDRLFKLEDPNLLILGKETALYETANTKKKTVDKSDKPASVAKVSKGTPARQSRPNTQQSKSSQKQSINKGKCTACGSTAHKASECPRKATLVCKTCNKPGHLSSVCMSGAQPTKSSPSQKHSGKKTDAAKTASLRCLGSQGAHNLPTPTLSAEIFSPTGYSFHHLATPDTGASRSVVSENLLRKHGIRFRRKPIRLLAADNRPIPCSGVVTLGILPSTSSTEPVPINAIVTDALHDEILLSWHDLQRMHIIPQHFPATLKAATYTVPELSEFSADFAKDYPDVLVDKITDTPMAGEPMKIFLDGDVIPHRTLTARQIPLHFKKEAEAVISDLIENGIITRVEKPTKWISPAHFVPKEGGKGGVRLVTDFTKLNKFVRRPVHPFPSTVDILRAIGPDAKLFAKLDAVQGYFQIGLDDESSELTTFLLPTGRYKYTRAPMGLSASSDEWCARSDAALAGLPGVQKLVDDILVSAPNASILHQRIEAVLEKCREHGLLLSKRKFQVGHTVSFAGHVISHAGVKPDPEKLSAIATFPAPTNISELRSFLGLANQLGHFLPDLAHSTAPLRGLLRKSNAFLWLPEHSDAFEATKKLLLSPAVCQPFDPQLPSILLTDASRHHGLGYALLQRASDETNRLVECGSRSLTDTESRYATIELETLAITWALEKCRFYLLGCPSFNVLTDHRPLEGVFVKALEDIENPRLFRLREKTLLYHFLLTWTPGKTHLIADALSRIPVFRPEKSTYDEPPALLRRMVEPDLAPLYAAAEACHVYGLLIAAVRDSTVTKAHPDSFVRGFTALADRLSLHNSSRGILVLLDARRIVVANEARSFVLRNLHASHAGLARTKQLARELYYWPGMNSEIANEIARCDECQRFRSSNPVPREVATLADEPMQQLSADLFQYASRHYLAVADRFSGYAWLAQLRDLSTVAILSHLREIFQLYGYPAAIRTDGGPQFRSDFTRFCEDMGINHELSSPYHPASNGHAESAVKALKRALQKTAHGQNHMEILTAWRATPRSDGVTPNDAFFRRKVRIFPSLVTAPPPPPARPEWAPGTRVRIQDAHSREWNATGVIHGSRNGNRSYFVTLPGGQTVLRNRRYLRPVGRGEETDSAYPSESSSEPSNKIKRRGRPRKGAVTGPPPQPSELPQAPEPPRRSSRQRRAVVRFDETR